MEIKILHLYYDLLNLYGEYGNVSALERYLENQLRDSFDFKGTGIQIEYRQRKE